MQACTELVARLKEWEKGVRKVMRDDRRYRSWADDIGREVLLFHLKRETEGLPVPEWQGVLDDELREFAYRIARSFHPRHVSTLDESAVLTKGSKGNDTGESCPEPRWDALLVEYSSHQIEAMIWACKVWPNVTQGKLAEAAGTPLRTFKRSCKRLRDHCNEL